jgi:hypothetical protein
MAKLNRLFLTGSDRNEFEHIHGKLAVDERDPRFVLVDDETAAKLKAFPKGIPVAQGQQPEVKARVRAEEISGFGLEASSDEVDSEQIDVVENDSPGLPEDSSAKDGDASGVAESGRKVASKKSNNTA